MGEPPAAIRIAFKKIGCHRKRFEIQSCQNRLADYYLAIHFHLQIRLVIEEKLQVQRRQRIERAPLRRAVGICEIGRKGYPAVRARLCCCPELLLLRARRDCARLAGRSSRLAGCCAGRVAVLHREIDAVPLL